MTIASAQTTIVSRVSQSNDDAEERISDGDMDTGSTDLELTTDGGDNQLVGIRFQDISIPQGTTILSASIQFTVDETDSGATSVTVFAQDTNNASAFNNADDNISNRNQTTASVAWNNIPAWNTVGESGPNQRTPDLTTIVQEIVNRGGWNEGNAIAFIISGFGERTAESFNGDPSAAPVLTITADFDRDPLPAIVPNLNKGLPFIFYIGDERPELYSVAPDPTASPLPSPTVINTTFNGAPMTFNGEGGGYRSTDRLVYVFDGANPPTNTSDLYAIDPATGVSTLIKANVVPGHVEGAEFYIDNSTGQEIFVIVHQNGTNGGPDRITALNPNANGAIPAWTPYAGYPVAISGAVSQADGISWNPETTEFYVQNDDNVDYYTVDIATGVTTFAYTTSLAIDGEGITYASDGKNYIEDEDNVGLGRTIFVVDTDNGNLIPAAQLGPNGDVESIMGNLGVRNDAGDAPSSYGYAAHSLPLFETTPVSIYLGATPPDSEDPFLNFSAGNSDDNNGDDEDGATSGGLDLSGQIFDLNTTKTINVATNGNGILNAWIDFNRDGDFDDAGEQIATDQSPTGGNIILNVAVPATASLGTSYTRFRYSSETGLASGNTEAADGEVEDFQIIINDTTACPSGEVVVENSTIQHVYATSVIVDQSVDRQNRARGSNDNTSATFNDVNDVLVLEMGESINSGDYVTVNGEDGDDFNIWVSSSATGPWTQVGNNAQLDFTFASPIDWLYIRFQSSDDSENDDLSFVDAHKLVSNASCEPDYDGDNVADRDDLDDDNDGIPNRNEYPCNTTIPLVNWYHDGNFIDPFIRSNTIVSSASTESGGAGVNLFYPDTYLLVQNVDAKTLISAIDLNEYVEYSFTTQNTLPEDYVLSQLQEFANGADYGHQWASYISTDGFATSRPLLRDVSPIGSTFSNNYDVEFYEPVILQAATTYTLRIYFYDVPDGNAKVAPFDDFGIIACSTNVDSDGDSLFDHLDLDSDNDGIYDAVEAGHDQAHTDGVVNGPYGANGLANSVETSLESGFLNYTIVNIDGDQNPDFKDTDSDNDGCNDADEAYGDPTADSDNNGYFGSGTPTVDANGAVTAASYPTPEDGDGNNVYDYREAGTAPSINDQPENVEACPGCNATFSVAASDADTLQWQLFDGSNWNDLSDSGIYGGTATSTLTLTNVSPSENGNRYRVIVENSSYSCVIETSDEAILTVQVKTVITNRRITHRVKKN